MRTTKIYVGNLPENAENAELQELFEKYGEVKECDIVKNYAFVHMSSEEDAKAAIEGLHNSEFNDSKISVEISHSKVRQRPGMGGKGQCYRCGRQGHWSKECPRNPAVRMNNTGPPVGYPTPGYGDRFPRFGMDRPFGADRSFGEQRGFVDRMRPYPDPYERRPPMPAPQQDNYIYYRRPYEGYGYARRSPPAPQVPSRYDFTQDPLPLHLPQDFSFHEQRYFPREFQNVPYLNKVPASHESPENVMKSVINVLKRKQVHEF